ncbi:hypothetical protein [Leeuwenhoekiella sp. H156]|uniref:hypothetical protein n=1 Tax=Leeuwenhoekiella sp. H156 TaxID=3450128 RepID=UPI003FA45701
MKSLLIILSVLVVFTSCNNSKETKTAEIIQDDEKLSELALDKNASLKLNSNKEAYDMYLAELQDEEYTGIQLLEAIGITEIVKSEVSEYRMIGMCYKNIIHINVSLTTEQFKKIKELDKRLFRYCVLDITDFKKVDDPESSIPNIVAYGKLLEVCTE